MKVEEFLDIVKRQITFVFDHKSIEKELRAHIEESMSDLMEDGFSKEDAQIQAIAQMGDPKEIGKQLNKEHNPILGYMWVLSKIVIGILIAYLLLDNMSSIGESFQLLTPMTVENLNAQRIVIDKDIEMPTHHLKIDYIYKDQYDYCHITYRAWRKFDYSRAPWNISPIFSLHSANNDLCTGPSMSSFFFWGAYGYKMFKLPEDDIIYLHTRDGQIIEINLKEYDYEKNS